MPVALAGEVGVVNASYDYGDVRRYGAVADFVSFSASATNNRVAIQNAIDSAAQSGAGIGRVYVPAPDGASKGRSYAIIGCLVARSDVEMVGDGYESCIRNTNLGPYSTRLPEQGCVIRLGALEGSSPWWLQKDPYDVLSGSTACEGQSTVVVNATPAQVPADFNDPTVFTVPFVAASNRAWQVGDLAFFRTERKDAFFTQKDVPVAFEVNEVTAVTPAAGGQVTLTLKYALRNDYRPGRITLYGLRPDPNNTGYAVEAVKRFNVRGLRLIAALPSGYAVLGYGGAFECELTDLWMEESGEMMQLNGISRCLFRDIRGHFSKGIGELGYYSHGNTFRHLHASRYPATVAGGDVAPRNGVNLTENASDNLLDDVRLDFGSGAGFAVVFGGAGNRLVNSTIVAGGAGAEEAGPLAAIFLGAPRLEFKPRACTVENVSVVIPSAGTGTAPYNHLARFGVLIDSGGPYGGFNTVRGLRVEGRPLVAAVGFARYDVLRRLRNLPTATLPLTPCENNLVADVTQLYTNLGDVSTGTPVVPATGTVVEYNNRRPRADVPGSTQEQLIDTTYRWGSNRVVDGRTPLRQHADRQTALGSFRPTTDTTVVEHVIAAGTVGSHHAWRFEAAGRVVQANAALAKYAAIRVGGVDVAVANLAAGAYGAWHLVVELDGRVPVKLAAGGMVDAGGYYDNQYLVTRRQVVRGRSRVNATFADAVVELTTDLNAADLHVQLVVRVTGATGATDTLEVDSWSVEPAGDEVSLVNWELLKAQYGDYPDIEIGTYVGP